MAHESMIGFASKNQANSLSYGKIDLGADIALDKVFDYQDDIDEFLSAQSQNQIYINDEYDSDTDDAHLEGPIFLPCDVGIPMLDLMPSVNCFEKKDHKRRLISTPFSEPNGFNKVDVAQKVISTITSKRAKPAKVIACRKLPAKNERVKGAVYQLGTSRKKWDGRQWRRICLVVDCCSAARGSADFCIVHSRGEVEETIVGGERVQIITLDQPMSPAGQKDSVRGRSERIIGRRRFASFHSGSRKRRS